MLACVADISYTWEHLNNKEGVDKSFPTWAWNIKRATTTRYVPLLASIPIKQRTQHHPVTFLHPVPPGTALVCLKIKGAEVKQHVYRCWEIENFLGWVWFWTGGGSIWSGECRCLRGREICWLSYIFLWPKHLAFALRLIACCTYSIPCMGCRGTYAVAAPEGWRY